jgi:hypothetical protein
MGIAQADLPETEEVPAAALPGTDSLEPAFEAPEMAGAAGPEPVTVDYFEEQLLVAELPIDAAAVVGLEPLVEWGQFEPAGESDTSAALEPEPAFTHVNLFGEPVNCAEQPAETVDEPDSPEPAAVQADALETLAGVETTEAVEPSPSPDPVEAPGAMAPLAEVPLPPTGQEAPEPAADDAGSRLTPVPAIPIMDLIRRDTQAATPDVPTLAAAVLFAGAPLRPPRIRVDSLDALFPDPLAAEVEPVVTPPVQPSAAEPSVPPMGGALDQFDSSIDRRHPTWSVSPEPVSYIIGPAFPTLDARMAAESDSELEPEPEPERRDPFVFKPKVQVEMHQTEPSPDAPTNPPLAEQPVALPEPPKVPQLALPAGMHERNILQRLTERPEVITGLLVAVTVNDIERVQQACGRPAFETLMSSIQALVQSVLGPKDFCCRLAEGEYLAVCPGLLGTMAARKVTQISETLWDFQLRSLGSYTVLFNWGACEVTNERLLEAMNQALERIHQPPRRGSRGSDPSGSRPRALMNS